MRRGDAPSQPFLAPVDVHASADGQVYMFKPRRAEPDVSSEEEELNVTELRSRDPSSQERDGAGDLLLLERDVSHQDNLSKLALQYGCKVADIKRANNLFQEQDMYALKCIKIPVKKHGLLTELRDPQKPAEERERRGPSASGAQEQYSSFLREVDSDIELLIQTSDPSDEGSAGAARPYRRWDWRNQHLRSYGADWGIQWWNAVIAMLLIGIVLPVFYVVYFKTQDGGETGSDAGVQNVSVATSNSTSVSFTSQEPEGRL